MSVFVFEEGGSSGNGTNGGNERKPNSQGSNRKNKNSSSKRSTDVDSGAASLCSSDLSVNSRVRIFAQIFIQFS